MADALMQSLRTLRADTQGLQQSILELARSGDRFPAILKREKKLFDQNSAEVDEDLAKALALANAPDDPNDLADSVTEIGNGWARAKVYWAEFVTAGTKDVANRQRRLTELTAVLDDLVLKVAYLTIPARVAEYVAFQRVGGAFNFTAAFADELPSAEARQQILQFLKDSPGAVDGVVDPKAGVIWITARDAARRRWSYIALAGILLAGGVVIALACLLGVGGPFVPGRLAELVVAYVGVGVGVLAHIAIDLYKQSKLADRTQGWTAVDDLVLWGHAHEMQMFITAFSIWAGLLVVALVSTRVEFVTAFVTGYSLDSVLDAALLRFTTVVTPGIDALKKQVAGAG
jgi:hypothetical protein